MERDEARRSFLPIIKQQLLLGTPVITGAYTVTPVSRVFLVQFPFAALWRQRPHAVLVAGGEEARQLPIPDVTRRAQLGIFAGVFVLLSIVRIANTRRKETRP
jgi:hypothetical protein